MRRRFAAALMTTTVLAAVLPPVTSTAAAAPTAPAASTPGAVRSAGLAGCVNKRTGALRVLRKPSAKCRKNERKVRWDSTGATGPAGAPGATGPAGTPLNVLAADGAVVGQLAGLLISDSVIWIVLRDGGLFYYWNDGSVFDMFGGSETVKYTNNTCTSPAYFKVSGAPPGIDVAAALGGYTRFWYRTDGGALPAWRVTTATVPLLAPTQLYYRTTAGVCQASGAPETGTLYLMESVASPPSFPGPLKVG